MRKPHCWEGGPRVERDEHQQALLCWELAYWVVTMVIQGLVAPPVSPTRWIGEREKRPQLMARIMPYCITDQVYQGYKTVVVHSSFGHLTPSSPPSSCTFLSVSPLYKSQSPKGLTIPRFRSSFLLPLSCTRFSGLPGSAPGLTFLQVSDFAFIFSRLYPSPRQYFQLRFTLAVHHALLSSFPFFCVSRCPSGLLFHLCRAPQEDRELCRLASLA